MPRKSKPGSVYPANWREIATAVKEAVGWRCVRCGAAHVNQAGHTLTVHHLDMDPGHSDPALWWWNLLPLCCPCHLQIQHKVHLDRPWVMTEHTPWFRPYVAGYYAKYYLQLDLSREQVDNAIGALLSVERRVVVLGETPTAIRAEIAALLAGGLDADQGDEEIRGLLPHMRAGAIPA